MQENEIQLIFMGGILYQYSIKDLQLKDFSCLMESSISIFDLLRKSSFYNLHYHPNLLHIFCIIVVQIKNVIHLNPFKIASQNQNIHRVKFVNFISPIIWNFLSCSERHDLLERKNCLPSFYSLCNIHKLAIALLLFSICKRGKCLILYMWY